MGLSHYSFSVIFFICIVLLSLELPLILGVNLNDKLNSQALQPEAESTLPNPTNSSAELSSINESSDSSDESEYDRNDDSVDIPEPNPEDLAAASKNLRAVSKKLNEYRETADATADTIQELEGLASDVQKAREDIDTDNNKLAETTNLQNTAAATLEELHKKGRAAIDIKDAKHAPTAATEIKKSSALSFKIILPISILLIYIVPM